MPHYHFRLQPLDQYFFGDERSFGTPDNANYFVRSRYWPQQTTLLGLLRFELLRRHGLLRQPGVSRQLDPAAEPLIGPASFNPRETAQTFGRIRQISPLWLEKDGQPYVIAPLDHALTQAPVAATAATYLNLVGTGSAPSPFYEGPDQPWLAKTPLTEALIPLGEPGDPIPFEEVFHPVTQVGIIKQQGQEEDASGFYRQTRYRLATGWTFAFAAELEEAKADEHHFQAVPHSRLPVGGERQPFALTATPLEQPPQFYPATPPAPTCRVLLISDAWISDPSALHQACAHFFAGDPVDFRAILTQARATTQYHNLTLRDQTRASHRAGFSHRYQLMPRGSVFHLCDGQWTALQAALQPPASWRTAGFNAYQFLSPLPSQS